MSGPASIVSNAKSLAKTLTSPFAGRFLPASCVSVHIGRGRASFVYARKTPMAVEVLGQREFEFSGESSGQRYPGPGELASAFEVFKSTHSIKSKDVALCIPGDWTVIKTVELPASVRENLASVLAFELDSLTPFRADEAFYSYSVLEESADKIKIRITAAKKQTVGPYLDALGGDVQRLTFEASALEALKRPGGPRIKGGEGSVPEEALGAALQALWPKAGDVDLLGKDKEEASGKSLLLFSAVLAALCLVALGFYLYAPLEAERKLLSDLDAQIVLTAGEAGQVREMKQRAKALQAEIRAIEAFKSASPPTLTVLREVTNVAPQSTWLTRLFVTGDRAELQGYSKSAPTLLKLLEKSDLFKKAEFLTTTVENRRLKADTFSIRVGFEGTGEDEEK